MWKSNGIVWQNITAGGTAEVVCRMYTIVCDGKDDGEVAVDGGIVQ